MTETTPEKGKALLPDQHAAAICRAIAYGALIDYRQARNDVEIYGGDVSDLYEPPSFEALAKSYRAVIDEWAPEPLSGPRHAGAILAQMAADQLVADVTSETLFDPGVDSGDALRLLAGVRRFVEETSIHDAIKDERKKFDEHEAPIKRAAEILIAEARKGDAATVSIKQILDVVERGNSTSLRAWR